MKNANLFLPPIAIALGSNQVKGGDLSFCKVKEEHQLLVLKLVRQ